MTAHRRTAALLSVLVLLGAACTQRPATRPATTAATAECGRRSARGVHGRPHRRHDQDRLHRRGLRGAGRDRPRARPRQPGADRPVGRRRAQRGRRHRRPPDRAQDPARRRHRRPGGGPGGLHRDDRRLRRLRRDPRPGHEPRRGALHVGHQGDPHDELHRVRPGALRRGRGPAVQHRLRHVDDHRPPVRGLGAAARRRRRARGQDHRRSSRPSSRPSSPPRSRPALVPTLEDLGLRGRRQRDPPLPGGRPRLRPARVGHPADEGRRRRLRVHGRAQPRSAQPSCRRP